MTKDARIVQICKHYIVVDYGQYRGTLNAIDLRQGTVRLCKDGKRLAFKPLVDKREGQRIRRKGQENQEQEVVVMSENVEKKKLTKEILKKKLDAGMSLEEIAAEGYNKKTVYGLASRIGLNKKGEASTTAPAKEEKTSLKPLKFESEATGFVYELDIDENTVMVYSPDGGYCIIIRNADIETAAHELLEIAKIL